MRRSFLTTCILVAAHKLLLGQDQGFQEKAGFDLTAQHFVEQADKFYETGALEPAAEYYAAAVEADPLQTKALYNLALVNFELKNFGKAELALEKLLKQSPTDTAAYELYGHALLERGQTDRAIECFNIVLYAEPTDARYVHRALANIGTRHTAQALQDFDEALRLNPQNFDACLGKGITLLEMGQPKLAAAWLEQALGIRPGDAAAMNNLAVIKYQMGERVEAMTLFRAALQSSRQSEIFLARASCYLLEQNFSDAIADAREAMLLDGENPDVYAFIGGVEMEKGDFEAAIESFGIAIDLKPDKADFYLRRADSCIKHKLYYDAVSDLYRALDLAPFNTEARALLQTAYSHIDADVLGQSLSEASK
jgi:tetratricopeptide (TPR) repeat protein